MKNTSYDAVILAAGRNSRLKGVVPSFYKPLVIVNGRPLIVTIVRNVLAYVQHAVVVVSPENCLPITEVLRDNGFLDDWRVSIIIQPGARGPGEGLFRALRSCRSRRTLLICADNIIPGVDYHTAFEADDRALARQVGDRDGAWPIVTASVTIIDDAASAARFTRVSPEQNEFIEDVPAPAGVWKDGSYRCWVGPLIFDTRESECLFAAACGSSLANWNEVKISGIFNNIDNLEINWVAGSSVDIGTSESLAVLEN